MDKLIKQIHLDEVEFIPIESNSIEYRKKFANSLGLGNVQLLLLMK